MFQFDSANTGYNPDASIATEQVGQRWRTSTLGEVVASPVIANGMAFVGSRDGKVYAMDVEDGSKQWEYNIGEPIESTPAVSNGSVFVGSTGGNVYSLSTDGDINWEFETNPDGANQTILHPISVDSGLVFVISTTSYEEGYFMQ
ncbi:outer membrane protein assembly factor BamB family protein [Haloarcula hispanica]|nr:PQQ-binding-like beta-propeller repeat protein [Haloarcula hispanica]